MEKDWFSRARKKKRRKHTRNEQGKASWVNLSKKERGGGREQNVNKISKKKHYTTLHASIGYRFSEFLKNVMDP